MPQTEEAVQGAPEHLTEEPKQQAPSIPEEMIKKLEYVLGFASAKGIEITEVKINGQVLRVKEAAPVNETSQS